MYVRFVVYQKVSQSKYASGLFVAAEQLRKQEELTPEEREQLDELLEWFRIHLPIPHPGQQDARAIYWFKPSATLHLRKMWEMARLLKMHGFDVEFVSSPFVGLAVYQDEYQIGAIPRVDRHRQG